MPDIWHRPASAAAYLQRTARQYPRLAALHHQGATWTYAELDRLATALATGLLSRTFLTPGERVGILSWKSPQAVAAMQAVLRADGAYVVLDARQPVHRLAEICRDCDIRVLMGDDTVARNAGTFREAGCSELVLLEPGGSPAAGFHHLTDWQTLAPINPSEWRGGDNLAAVLYTSGSTGVPKGVQITHANLTSFVEWAGEQFRFDQDDVFLNHAHLSFDLPVLDLYNAFRAGGSVILLDESDAAFPRAVVSAIVKHRATNLYMVPSALTALMNQGALLDTPPQDLALRRILYAGEAFPVPALRTLRGHLPAQVDLVNLYGPIESNVCTAWPVPAGVTLGDDTPIGAAVGDLRVSVRREDGDECDPGETGEIWVAGPTVSPGYWRRSDLDADKFQHADGVRWYRTGDLGLRGDGGELRFRGRADSLIKRRGFRIELGDIESTLARHPNVLECAVVSRDTSQGPEIHAWYTTSDPALTGDGIRAFLAQSIPSYMIPDSVRRTSSLPKTQRDKIDRIALAAQASSDRK